MLGETKYYYAIYFDGNPQKPVIVSSSANPGNGIGIANAWTVAGPVVSDVPVTIVGGYKLGAYWERRTATTRNAASPVLRLVGRYWEEGKTYSIKLTTIGISPSASKRLLVVLPKNLGGSHPTATDVKGNTFNLDSVIIAHAGQRGVLPQILKGIIQDETVGKFLPAYRYEPFTDMAEVQNGVGSDVFMRSPYWVTTTSMGTPSIPTDHTVLIGARGATTYPKFTRVWDFFQAHVDFYGLNHYRNSFHLETKWKKIHENALLDFEGKPARLIEDSTNARFYSYLQFEWNGGMGSAVAQTRIAASYGIMQLLYSVSSVDNYPQDASQRPEDISDYRIGMSFGVNHFVRGLSSVLGGTTRMASSDWVSGLENMYNSALAKYNGGDGYVQRITTNSQNYYPVK